MLVLVSENCPTEFTKYKSNINFKGTISAQEKMAIEYARDFLSNFLGKFWKIGYDCL